MINADYRLRRRDGIMNKAQRWLLFVYPIALIAVLMLATPFRIPGFSQGATRFGPYFMKTDDPIYQSLDSSLLLAEIIVVTLSFASVVLGLHGLVPKRRLKSENLIKEEGAIAIQDDESKQDLTPGAETSEKRKSVMETLVIDPNRPFLQQIEEAAMNEGDEETMKWLEENIYSKPDVMIEFDPMTVRRAFAKKREAVFSHTI